MRELNKREKIIAVLVAIALVVFLVQRLAVEPQGKKFRQLQKELASLDEQYADIGPKLVDFNTLNSNLVKKEIQLAELEQVLSRQAEVAEIINEVSMQARTHGLELQNIRPQKTTFMRTRAGRHGEFRWLVLNVGIRGLYQQLGNFLGDLEQQPFYVKVAELHVAQGKERAERLEIQLKLEIVVRS